MHNLQKVYRFFIDEVTSGQYHNAIIAIQISNT
jgi:polysaccharide deacetylase 2 family uncharacterized protein YibQ